jgi:hypothetical protein
MTMAKQLREYITVITIPVIIEATNLATAQKVSDKIANGKKLRDIQGELSLAYSGNVTFTKPDICEKVESL